MLFIHHTVSLCDHCYRHVPAIVYEDQGKILMRKRCDHHGEITNIVETDPEFYYSLSNTKISPPGPMMVIEATDRCQLKCLHCYHLPDNAKEERSTQEIIQQLLKFPRQTQVFFGGAESTLRDNFDDLCRQITELNFFSDRLTVLTNGVSLSNYKKTKKYFDSGLTHVAFGLNHHSYQGKKVHEQQLAGLKNVAEVGYHIPYVSYTLESLDHIPEILIEIYKLSKLYKIDHFRIRCGSFIGRSSDQHRSYLSVLLKKLTDVLGDRLIVDRTKWFANPYKLVAKWGDIDLRLIQWPDVSNIDMEELATGPWAQFYDGPATNFVHNVITRDAYINEKMPKLDMVPQRYQFRENEIKSFWKENWTGPTPFSKFEYEWVSDIPQPIEQQQQIIKFI